MHHYCLVTGANGGIGKETVKRLLRDGFRVLATGLCSDFEIDDIPPQFHDALIPVFVTFFGSPETLLLKSIS